MGYCGGWARTSCSVPWPEEGRRRRTYWTRQYPSWFTWDIDQERRHWGNSIKWLSTQFWFGCVGFTASHYQQTPNAIIIYRNQHATETRSLTDSRWLPHRKANQFQRTTAIIKEWNVPSTHTHMNGSETKAPVWPSQGRETASRRQCCRKAWVFQILSGRPPLTHTDLCSTCTGFSGFLRPILGFPTSVPLLLFSCLGCLTSPVSVPWEPSQTSSSVQILSLSLFLSL